MRDQVTGWNWHWVCAASWLSMMGAWAAAAAVLDRPDYTLRTGAILVGAFPFAYYLPFSKVSRLKVNLIVLAAAVLLGLLEIHAGSMSGSGALTETLGGSYQTLIAAFVWIMVFRAFAIRNERDAAETVLAVASILVLVLVSYPPLIAVVATALSLMGSVAVLAANHEVTWTPVRARLQATSRARPPVRRTANSWMTLYAFGLLCAFLASQGFQSTDITSALGRALQMRLALMMMRASTQQYDHYVSADARLYVFGLWPAGNQPLFEVKTDTPTNWRLATYTDYEGGWWSQGIRPLKDRVPIGRHDWELPIPDGVGKSRIGPTIQMTVTARMPIGATAPAVFWPERVHMVRVRPKVDQSGALWTQGYLRPGESYTVTALRPRLGREPRALSPQMREACLQLPDSLPERVRDLALRLTAGKPGPTQKISALQVYLNSTCRYDLNPPVDRYHQDFVDRFLFETHRGHCVYFASAMVVMARCIGLPARLVSGFLEGEPQEDGETFLVRAKDAHAWAEVFVPGDGWKEVDPTPGRPPTPSELAAQAWDRVTSGMGRGIMRALVWAAYHAGGAVVLLLLVGVGGWGFRRWRWTQMVRVNLTGATPDAQVDWAYRQMLRWLAEAGAPKPLPVTPLEHTRSLDDRWDPVRRQAEDLSHRYYKSHYSAGGAGERDAQLAVQDAEMVRDHWLELRKQKPDQPKPE